MSKKLTADSHMPTPCRGASGWAVALRIAGTDQGPRQPRPPWALSSSHATFTLPGGRCGVEDKIINQAAEKFGLGQRHRPWDLSGRKVRMAFG